MRHRNLKPGSIIQHYLFQISPTASEEDYDGEDLLGGNALDGSIDLSPEEPSTEGSFPENTAKVHPEKDDDLRVSELEPGRYGKCRINYA